MRYYFVFLCSLIALRSSAQLSVGSLGLTVLPATTPLGRWAQPDAFIQSDADQ